MRLILCHSSTLKCIHAPSSRSFKICRTAFLVFGLSYLTAMLNNETTARLSPVDRVSPQNSTPSETHQFKPNRRSCSPTPVRMPGESRLKQMPRKHLPQQIVKGFRSALSLPGCNLVGLVSPILISAPKLYLLNLCTSTVLTAGKSVCCCNVQRTLWLQLFLQCRNHRSAKWPV